MTNYRVHSRWCRVFPVMILAILAIAPSAIPKQRKAQPPEVRTPVRVRLWQLEHSRHLALPAQEGRNRHELYVRCVLLGGPSERNYDLGCRRGP